MKSIFLKLFRIFGVIRDVKNYYFLLEIIKKEKINSPLWAKNKLRVDYIGRIYTVINLPPEVTMSQDVPKELYPAYLIEQTKELNAYLTGLNLHEIIIPEFKEIPNSSSYLLIYYPYFRDLSWWWIFSRTLFWTLFIISNYKFHWISTIYHLIIS